VSWVKFSFANAGLSEDDASDLVDLLFKERTSAAQQAGLKIRDQAQRGERGELTEEIELTPDEQAALHALLDGVPGEPRTEAIGHLRDELRTLAPS
jgi:hypothetical protein